MAARHLLLATACLAVLSGPARADSTRITWAGNGHEYKRFDTTMGWFEAKRFCEGVGGYLATITSQEENDFVWNELASMGEAPGGVWLGATNDRSTSGEEPGPYEWVTGEPFIYTHWYVGEPNDSSIVSGSGEHYLMFFPKRAVRLGCVEAGSWNDVSSVNRGSLWNQGQFHYANQWRPMSTLCEWGGDFSATSF